MSLTLPPSAKIHLSLAPCDMRKGFDKLSEQLRNILRLNPFSGAVFLFLSKREQSLKALVWDGSGCRYAKCPRNACEANHSCIWNSRESEKISG